MMSGYGDGWWVVMWVWMAAFWLLVLAGVVWLAWRLSQPTRSGPSPDEILKQRLARGEIDAGQYRALQQELGTPGGGVSKRGGVVAMAIACVAALAVVTLIAVPAWAAGRGNGDRTGYMSRMMGGGSMGQMMAGMMGGGQNTSNAPLRQGTSAETVAIQNLAFSPGNLQVPVGATVTWANRDSVPHNTTSTDGSWKTQTLSQGDSGSVTFDRAGEYDYYCTIHPSMKAHLSVK